MSETETPPDQIEICPECGSPLMTPKALPLNAGVDICPACGQTLLATTVLTIYGPDTNPDELLAKIAAYLSERERLQTRCEQEHQSPTFDEAVDLVKLYQWPNLETPAAWSIHRVVEDCVKAEDGREMLVEKDVQGRLEFWQDKSRGSWDRFLVQEGLEESAKRVPDHRLAIEIFQRLASKGGRLNRPPGRYYAGINQGRDLGIISVIKDLERMGMNAARNEETKVPHSACDAVAEVLEMTYAAVETVWKGRNR